MIMKQIPGFSAERSCYSSIWPTDFQEFPRDMCHLYIMGNIPPWGTWKWIDPIDPIDPFHGWETHWVIFWLGQTGFWWILIAEQNLYKNRHAAVPPRSPLNPGSFSTVFLPKLINQHQITMDHIWIMSPPSSFMIIHVSTYFHKCTFSII